MEGADGENASVLFYRNRNGLGVAPSKISAPAKEQVGSDKKSMMVAVDDDSE